MFSTLLIILFSYIKIYKLNMLKKLAKISILNNFQIIEEGIMLSFGIRKKILNELNYWNVELRALFFVY